MAENHFDRLSDDLLRLIFNRVVDAKSICRCLSVSNRFSSLASQANSVVLRIPPPRCHVTPPPPLFPEQNDNLFTNLVTKLITRPLHFLHRVIISPAHDDDGPHFSPARLLKPFKEVADLRVQLPYAPSRGDLSLDEDRGGGTLSLLKWNAAFGRQLKSCVILGAKEIINNGNEDVIIGGEEFSELIHNEELQLRVVCTISCLIAASARHCLIKQVIVDCPMLRRVEITDEEGQGRVILEDDDVAEMRNDEKLEEEVMSRVPAMRMKMWFVPGRLELPGSGRVVVGATLVVIRAVDGKRCGDDDDDLLMAAFDGEEENEIAVEMAKKKKKTYTTLEIDSF